MIDWLMVALSAALLQICLRRMMHHRSYKESSESRSEQDAIA